MNCIFLRRGYGTSGDGVNYVEYIKTSGTQYFEINYVPNSKTRIVLDVKWDGTTAGYLFGTQNTASSTDGYSNSLYVRSDGTPRSDYYGSSLTGSASFPTTRTTVERNANVTTVGGAAITNTAATKSSQYPLFLFAVNTAGSARYIGVFECDENGIQIYDDGVTLTHDYRPALDPDGVACLYDKVTKTYLYMSGSGTIEVGPSISGGSSSGYVVNIVDNVTYDVFTVTIGGTAYTSNATVPIEAGTAITVKLDNEDESNAIYLNGTQVAINSTAAQGYTFVPNSNTTITFTLVDADQGRWDCYITTE